MQLLKQLRMFLSRGLPSLPHTHLSAWWWPFQGLPASALPTLPLWLNSDSSPQTKLKRPSPWSFYFFKEVWQHVRKRVTFSDLQNVVWWAQTTERSAALQNPLLSLPVSRSLLSIASPTWFLQSSFTCCRHHKTEVTPRYFYSICLLLFSMTPLWLVATEATHSVEWGSIHCMYVP